MTHFLSLAMQQIGHGDPTARPTCRIILPYYIIIIFLTIIDMKTASKLNIKLSLNRWKISKVCQQ